VLNNYYCVGNKKVEFDEFVALITAKVEQAIKDLRVKFDSFDKDKSGALTKQELTDLLKELGVDTSSDKVEKAFKKVDDNKDGKITFDGKSIILCFSLSDTYYFSQILLAEMSACSTVIV
jgi:Ca2+-binding EF-hand superfamily protein